MIVSFKSEETRLVWIGQFSKKIKLPASIHNLARRKLRMLYAAPDIEALKIPPNNRLEQLKGDRRGFWSIRINDKYRICFRWLEGNAHDVEIVDYH